MTEPDRYYSIGATGQGKTTWMARGYTKTIKRKWWQFWKPKRTVLIIDAKGPGPGIHAGVQAADHRRA